MKHQLIFFSTVLATLLTAFAQTPPSDAAMAKLSCMPFGTLEKRADLKSSGYRMDSVTVSEADAAELPPGVDRGIKLKSVALPGGGKGDCTVGKTLSPEFKMLGAWFYISPDTTVDRIGFQIQEAGGEYFLLTFPGDFTGWKWLEGPREDIRPMIPVDKSGHDGIFDQPPNRVSVVWFVKNENPSEIGVAALTQGE
jgi:hypothetical protein